ncbi:MAG: hypothetical protein D3917_08165 [Candidatus Electrothrix sp. AX5]|nr:hypothetical protein [Candidatus Electrothrix sp. AX5]
MSGRVGYSRYSITLRLGNRVEGKSSPQTRTVAGTPLSGNRKLSVANANANANATFANNTNYAPSW